ncbi:MAG: helix-turn-helix domain-containing protein [Corynebacterium sp.]|nr:helix-turn-helix domain-containing protein [Corynebacterium sp.]
MDPQRSECPINRTVEILGDKWSLLILRDVLLRGARSFGDVLQANVEQISAPMLSRRLKHLVAEGFLEKTTAARGMQGHYAPTQKAIDAIPILVAFAQFGSDYYPETADYFPEEFRDSQKIEAAMRMLKAE